MRGVITLGIAALISVTIVAKGPVPPPKAPNFEAPSAPMLVFQTVTNPTTVDFTSTDHNVVVDGQAVVTRYDLTVYTVANQATAVKTVDIGKPTSATTAVSYTGLRTAMTGLPNGQYVVKLAAVGPGGASAASAASDPFNQLGPPATTSKPVVR